MTIRSSPSLQKLVEGVAAPAPGADIPAPPSGVIRIDEVIAALKNLDQSKFSFVADVGDSWFISLELRFDVFVAAGYYSSMGFAVPAALGVGIAEPSRRPLAIVGDGAFQMTGTELATLVDQKLRPIILRLNNGGYGMLEAIDGPRSYYERRNWDFPALARAWVPKPNDSRPPPISGQLWCGPRPRTGAYLIERGPPRKTSARS